MREGIYRMVMTFSNGSTLTQLNDCQYYITQKLNSVLEPCRKPLAEAYFDENIARRKRHEGESDTRCHP